MIDANKFTNQDFFATLIKLSALPPDCNLNVLYACYCESVNRVANFINQNDQIKPAHVMFNPLAILNYLVSEYVYSFGGMSIEKVQDLSDNHALIPELASIVVDKYLTLDYFSYLKPRTNAKYFPPLTSLDLYVTKLQHLLNGMPKNHLPETLMNDMYSKFFSMVKCIIELVVNGHETEALATWRTLHETECIILILNKYPESVETYLKHINYSLAYRNSIADKAQQDLIFQNLKEEMKALGLKSKDMKRYIENGWIYAIPEIKNDPNVKLNFRMGIEYTAGLEDLNDWYEVSSEIAHGSPLLIYSNKPFFLNMTIVGTLTSFLRVEELFSSSFIKGCEDAELLSAFKKNRELRLGQIKRITELEEKKFDYRSEKILDEMGIKPNEVEE